MGVKVAAASLGMLERKQTRRRKKEDLTKRAHPDLNQGPADLQSAALTTELCTRYPVA